MDEKEILQSVLDKLIKGGNYTLTSQEQKTLMELAGDEAAQQSIGLSADEFQSILQDGVNGASNKESFLTRLERKVKRGETTERLAAGFNVAKDILGFGASLAQIRQSNNTLNRLTPPGAPGVPGQDPGLNQSIEDARNGTLSAARVAATARSGINDQYVRDLSMAEDISNGQSGTYGAYGQLAAIRRNKALAGLTPMIDDVRAREQSRLDSLVNQRNYNEQRNFQNRAALYDSALNQYNQQMQAAGQQGMVGRENLFGSIGSLANNLAVYGGYGHTNRAYTGNPEIDSFDAKANAELSRLRPRRAASAPVNMNYRPNYGLGQDLNSYYS